MSSNGADILSKIAEIQAKLNLDAGENGRTKVVTTKTKSQRTGRKAKRSSSDKPRTNNEDFDDELFTMDDFEPPVISKKTPHNETSKHIEEEHSLSFSEDREETPQKKYIDPVAMGLQGLAQKRELDDIDTSEFEIVLREIKNTTKNVLITGKAGTGKSTFLKYLLANLKKNAVIAAPTGIAAINVGGQTIHSLFGLKPEIQMPEHLKINFKRKAFFSKLDILIIDEISMVRADVLDAIDFLLREYRDIDYPFGAVQVIMFGDLFQLPPVVSKFEKEAFEHLYPESPYFFSSNVMKERESDFVSVELSKIYRQQDENFISILNKIRRGGVSFRELAPINDRTHDRAFNTKNCITLTTTRDLASEINQSRLEEIKGKEFVFEAEIEGDFDEKHYPTDSSLILKVGAQVMMIKNDMDGRWVNGSIGTIVTVDEDEHIQVEVNGNVHTVPKERWEKVKYDLTGSGTTATIDRVPVGVFKQYPIKLAWAVTIHKSQGLTFDKVIIDMGRGGFAHGQTYVALSRCKTLQGIKLSRIIFPKDVIVDKRITDFYTKLMEKKNQG